MRASSARLRGSACAAVMRTRSCSVSCRSARIGGNVRRKQDGKGERVEGLDEEVEERSDVRASKSFGETSVMEDDPLLAK